jgi:hypothetical protein
MIRSELELDDSDCEGGNTAEVSARKLAKIKIYRREIIVDKYGSYVYDDNPLEYLRARK